MKLIQNIKRRLGDMRTLKDTGLLAEKIANEMSEVLVGAEHWLLAALELPDGTARQSFSNAGVKAGVDAGASVSLLRADIAQQYQDASNAEQFRVLYARWALTGRNSRTQQNKS